MTLSQAGLSTLFSALIGLPLGLAVGRKGRITEVFLAVPFAVPTVVAAVSWVLILNRDWNYSLRAVMLAHVFFNAPWVALVVSQARRRLADGRLEAARTLGATPSNLFYFIEWPAVRWSFSSAVSQSFSFCVMSFALVLILGGGPPVETLETAVYSRVRLGGLDLDGAVVCAVWELAITLAPWFFVLFFQARDRATDPRERKLRERESSSPSYGSSSWRRAGAVSFTLSLVFIAPYLVTLVGSGWGLILGTEWLRVVLPALSVSSSLAFSSAALVVVTAVAAVFSLSRLAFSRPKSAAFLAGALSFSGGMSALVLGLGFWLAFGRFIDPFEGSGIAIVAIQGALFFNLAFRLFWPLALERKSALMEAASLLGAKPLRAFFEVEWWRWSSVVVSAFALVAAASFGEVAAVSLFYSEKLVPLPLLIARWSSQYRFEEAQSLAALLFLIAWATVSAVMGVSPGRFQKRLQKYLMRSG